MGKGQHHTKKSRLKMSKSQLGKKATKETKNKMRLAHLGKPKFKRRRRFCPKGHDTHIIGRFKNSECKACGKLKCDRLRRNGYMRVYGKKWRKKNKHRNLGYQRKYNYGVTEQQIKIIENKQKYRCVLCHKKCKLFVDHNHKTNKIRGLLCRQCNLALGLIKDNPKIALRIVEYLS